MTPRAATRWGGAGGVLLALAGLWLGHTAEYVRVWGTHGWEQVLFGSVHTYMLPLAAVLALGGVVFGVRLGRVWISLGRRLDAGRAALASLLRGQRPPDPAPASQPGLPTLSSGLLIIWPVITAIQVLLYVVQENVEAVAAHLPTPGLGAIAGVHALAPLVHAGVALALLFAAAAVFGVLRRRAAAVVAVEAAALRVLQALLRGAPCEVARPPDVVTPPLHRFGAHLWCRPPPLLPAY